MKVYIVNNSEFTIEEIIQSIIKLNLQMCDFWSDASGWAPIETADLLDKSRLDWQMSLSKYLHNWVGDIDEDDFGSLILAWANIGSIVEGTIKLALSVYLNDYINDSDKVISKGKINLPDELQLERLRIFCNGKLWSKDDIWNDWILHIQHRRNTIHAFKDRELGNFEEFYNDLKIYLEFLIYINDSLPYPDHMYIPRCF